jgi:hypothetical protein
VLGRAFADSEDRPAAPRRDDRRGLWKRRFGGDPAIVGASHLNGIDTAVVGGRAGVAGAALER